MIPIPTFPEETEQNDEKLSQYGLWHGLVSSQMRTEHHRNTGLLGKQVTTKYVSLNYHVKIPHCCHGGCVNVRGKTTSDIQ